MATTDRCTIRQALIAPREIHFLRFILEGYEGLAVVTTVQPEAGWVQLSIAPGCEPEVETILNAESSRLELRWIYHR